MQFFERPRPAGPVLIAASVLAVLALITLAVGRLAFGSGAGTSGTSSGGAHRTASTRPASTASTAAGRSTHATTPPPPPPPTQYLPQSTTAAGATYVVTAATYSVQVSAPSRGCWVEVGPTSSGPFSFASTLPAGSSQAFTATGGELWVRLGAPANATVSVNGVPVQVPAEGSNPFNLTFTSSAA